MLSKLLKSSTEFNLGINNWYQEYKAYLSDTLYKDYPLELILMGQEETDEKSKRG